jgi:TonB family protein
MRTLSSEQWAAAREVRSGPTTPSQSPSAPRPRPPEEKKPEEKEKEQAAGPVVPGESFNVERPEDARWAATRDNRVEKETVARNRTTKYRNATPQQTAPEKRPALGQDDAAQAQLEGNGGMGDEVAPAEKGKGARRSVELPRVEERERIALRPTEPKPGPGPSVRNQSESEGLEGNSDRLRVDPGSAGGDGKSASEGRAGLPRVATLLPSQATVDQITGQAASIHAPGVEEGEGTFLNTREWKHAGFMGRVQRAVSWNWEAGDVLRKRDPTGSIYAGRDRLTVVSITLDERGYLKDVHVVQPSGLDFLDVEAMQAIERAQPFPRPPAGMREEDGMVRFTFSFYVEMGGGSALRLFRGGR